jgi:hypothetical protein
MMRFFDKLNALTTVVVVLVLSLVINGFLFYHHQVVNNAATVPLPAATELDAVSSTNTESVNPVNQTDPQANEADEEADYPRSDKKDSLVDQESEPEPELSPVPYRPAPDQETVYPAPVAETPAVVPTDVSTPTYPEPVSDKNPEAEYWGSY